MFKQHIVSYIVITFISTVIKSNNAFCTAVSDISRIEKYLNSFHTFSAKFNQIGPGNEANREGMVYIVKPAKLKWEYILPKKITIISKDKKVSYYDYEMDELSYIRYDDVLLYILTAQNISLEKSLQIISIKERQGMLDLTINKKLKSNDEVTPNITISFKQNPALELADLKILNEDGKVTQIVFSEVQLNKQLDQSLFTTHRNKLFEINRD